MICVKRVHSTFVELSIILHNMVVQIMNPIVITSGRIGDSGCSCISCLEFLCVRIEIEHGLGKVIVGCVQ